MSHSSTALLSVVATSVVTHQAVILNDNMQEMTRKRRYGRLQKAMGDVSLLAGSPTDAIEHYTTAIDLSKACGDVVWTGAAISGVASAKVG